MLLMTLSSLMDSSGSAPVHCLEKRGKHIGQSGLFSFRGRDEDIL